MTPYRRGDVVWHPAPFRNGGRPYIVLSDDSHPFYGEEYIVVGVTTTGRERAVELTPEMWDEGGAPERSWASPWYTMTLKHANISDHLGRLTSDATDQIATALASLVGLDMS
jgi:mRNA-degrading endonuclease toxin of MazEF toxin-antitoxin module